MDTNTKRTWAEISLGNLEHNIRTLRAAVHEGCRFLGVVKANAYGHGAVPVAKRMEELGVEHLAVACIDEAIELREAGIALPILILGHTPPEYTGELIKYDITQAVGDEETARACSDEAVKLGKKLRVHIKLDTGMGRLGFQCRNVLTDSCVDAVESCCRLPGLDAEGIFTHFAVSDEEGEECREYTLSQFGLFMEVIGKLEARGVRFALRHCANSGAVLNYPEMALDMIRPGIETYGYGDGGRLGLRPCMSLKSRVYAVRDCAAGTRISYGGTYEATEDVKIAVVPVGYGDGFFRCLSNKCEFLINGSMAPQRGRICMDMCMVDVSHIPGVKVGDVVEIFGEGAELEKLARTAGTISYELLCAVSKRIPRVYK